VYTTIQPFAIVIFDLVYTTIQSFAIALQGNASSSTHRQLKPSYLHNTQNAHTHVQANTHLSYVIQTQTLPCTAYLSPIAAPICCSSIAACSRRIAPSPHTKHTLITCTALAQKHAHTHTNTTGSRHGSRCLWQKQCWYTQPCNRCVCVCSCVCVWERICVDVMWAWIHACVCTYLHACVCVCVCVWVCAYVCVCVCICMGVCMCVFVWYVL
jgi:hypothetical protein